MFDKYNVVIKDGIIHAIVNGFEFEMAFDDFNKFSNMVKYATLLNLGASFIDDTGNIHSLNK